MRAERGVAAVVNFFGGFLCGTQEIRKGEKKSFNHGWGASRRRRDWRGRERLRERGKRKTAGAERGVEGTPAHNRQRHRSGAQVKFSSI
jgi:hypothetical protein